MWPFGANRECRSEQPREGSIKEQSKLFGAQYSYTFDFSKVKAFVENEAAKAGWAFRYRIPPLGL